MTRAQAAAHLPTLFRRSCTAGVDDQTLGAVNAFVDWLYKNAFEIVSYKERKRKEGKHG